MRTIIGLSFILLTLGSTFGVQYTTRVKSYPMLENYCANVENTLTIADDDGQKYCVNIGDSANAKWLLFDVSAGARNWYTCTTSCTAGVCTTASAATAFTTTPFFVYGQWVKATASSYTTPKWTATGNFLSGGGTALTTSPAIISVVPGIASAGVCVTIATSRTAKVVPTAATPDTYTLADCTNTATCGTCGTAAALTSGTSASSGSDAVLLNMYRLQSLAVIVASSQDSGVAGSTPSWNSYTTVAGTAKCVDFAQGSSAHSYAKITVTDDNAGSVQGCTDSACATCATAVTLTNGGCSASAVASQYTKIEWKVQPKWHVTGKVVASTDTHCTTTGTALTAPTDAEVICLTYGTTAVYTRLTINDQWSGTLNTCTATCATDVTDTNCAGSSISITQNTCVSDGRSPINYVSLQWAMPAGSAGSSSSGTTTTGGTGTTTAAACSSSILMVYLATLVAILALLF